MERPSLDQLGSASAAGEVVTRRAGPPEALTTYTSTLVPMFGAKLKAMLFPSGDQRGEAEIPSFPREVNRRACPPRASTTQISNCPLRVDVKATRSPSGEY